MMRANMTVIAEEILPHFRYRLPQGNSRRRRSEDIAPSCAGLTRASIVFALTLDEGDGLPGQARQ